MSITKRYQIKLPFQFGVLLARIRDLVCLAQRLSGPAFHSRFADARSNCYQDLPEIADRFIEAVEATIAQLLLMRLPGPPCI